MPKARSNPSPPPEPATTRDRLIAAGLEVFGEQGFAAATTRAIAERAAVNLAAIPYHFGGKEGLYHAVVGFIAGRARQRLDPLLAAPAAGGALPPAVARQKLEALLGGVVDFVVGTPEAVLFSRIVLREQMAPSAAFAIIFEHLMQPLLESLALLLTNAEGAAVPDRHRRLRAATLLGQVLIFRFGRETAVRGIGLEGYSAAETAEIRAVVLTHLRAILQSPDAPAAGQPGEEG